MEKKKVHPTNNFWQEFIINTTVLNTNETFIEDTKTA